MGRGSRAQARLAVLVLLLYQAFGAPKAPHWYESRSFVGVQQFRSGFPPAILHSTNPKANFKCSSTTETMPDVRVDFGPTGPEGKYGSANFSMYHNFSLPSMPGFVNGLSIDGPARVQATSEMSNLVGVSKEYMVAWGVDDVRFGKTPLRSFGISYGKIGQAFHAGNFETLRLIESLRVSSNGFVSSFSGLSGANEVSCSEGTSEEDPKTAYVTTLVPVEYAWHSEPWGPCSTTATGAAAGVAVSGSVPSACIGSRSRQVECRDGYGNTAASDDPCKGIKPTSTVQCAAAECAEHVRAAFPNASSLAATPLSDGVVLANETLAGTWRVLLQTFDAPWSGNGTGPARTYVDASEALARLVELRINGSSMQARLEDDGRVFSLDTGALNATEHSSDPGGAVATVSGPVHSSGGGRIDFGPPTARTSLAYSSDPAAAPAGATALLDAGPAGMSVVLTPGVPSSAAAFPIAGRAARSKTSDAARLAPILSAGSSAAFCVNRTAVLAGKAVPAPTRYVQLPHAQCRYYAGTNNCLRKRPPLRCEDAGNRTVSPAFCAGQAVPPAVGPSELACGSSCLSYHVGPWGACSKPCEGGAKYRTVLCQDAQNRTQPDSHCAAFLGPKPATTATCNAFACAEYRAGEWSACSSSCGPGTRSRDVKCFDIDGELPESRCVAEGRAKPNATLPCFPCPCEDESLEVRPVVIAPGAADAVDQARLSRAGSYNYTTSGTICPGQFRLLRISQLNCYRQSARDRFCSQLNGAPGTSVVPFAARTEAGEAAPTAPAFLPPTVSATAADVRLYKPDPTCAFNPLENADVALVDTTRQAAAGLCREVRG